MLITKLINKNENVKGVENIYETIVYNLSNFSEYFIYICYRSLLQLSII